jgi:hypothetical protein
MHSEQIDNYVTQISIHRDPQVKSRMNIMVFARLKEKSSGKIVCVGTYHMPCMFWLPSVMVMHAALASQRIKALAGDDPHVLAGGALRREYGDFSEQLS